MKPLALVAGAVGDKLGNGGAAWTRLSWALGLKRLGYRVVFVDEIRSAEEGASDLAEGKDRVAYLASVMGRFDIPWVAVTGREVTGADRIGLRRLCEQAEFLLNITGHLRNREWLDRIACRIYLDLDPGYTQIWASQGFDLGLERHQLHFTIGENIPGNGGPLPDDGRWAATRQPVQLDLWPAVESSDRSLFTTVAAWRGAYGALEGRGRAWGPKAHGFRRLIDMPSRVPDARFEIALDIDAGDDGDRLELRRKGWKLRDPRRRLSTPEAFRDYIQTSGAELSPAQGVYVDSRCGWFSDRSLRYLASGKPVLVEETGFSSYLPTGEGLLSYRNFEEAVDGVRRIQEDYRRHSRAARRLAQEFFDSEGVLKRLLKRAGIPLPSVPRRSSGTLS